MDSRRPAAMAAAAGLAALCAVSGLVPRSAPAQVITLTGTQTLTVRPGDRYDGIIARDSSTVNVLGGTVFDLRAFDNSSASVSGGSVFGILGGGDATVNVGGDGNVGTFYTTGCETVQITGGRVALFFADRVGTASLSGGSVTSVRSFDADITVTGGVPGQIVTFLGGDITLRGYDFSVVSSAFGILAGPFPDVVYAGMFHTVTGRLADTDAGTGLREYQLFEAAIRINERTRETAPAPGVILLDDLGTGTRTRLDAAVPEPGSLALAALAALWLAGVRAARSGRWPGGAGRARPTRRRRC